MRNKSIVCFILISILLTPFFLIKPAGAELTSYQNISVQQAKNMIQHSTVILLVVRNQSEYDLGHLYDAHLIPLNSLENKTKALEPPTTSDPILLDIYLREINSFQLASHKNDTIIVYCSAGGRSANACEILIENGFSQVFNMQGGITAWLQANYEIYTSNHHATIDFDNWAFLSY